MLGLVPDTLPARLHAVREYWLRRRNEVGDVPHLTDIDMMDIYIHAPYLFIADCLDTTTDDGTHAYRWRYWGTAVRDLTGIEATGKFLHETHEVQAAREAAADYDAVLAEGAPSYWQRNVRTKAEDRSFIVYQRIVFPLRGANRAMAHVLGVFVTDDPAYSATRSGERLAHGKIDMT